MKSFKQFPSWIKDGIIGGLIPAISGLLSETCATLFVDPSKSLGFECISFVIPWIPFWFFPGVTNLSTPIFSIIVIIAWIILGILFGKLYRLIKKESNK